MNLDSDLGIQMHTQYSTQTIMQILYQCIYCTNACNDTCTVQYCTKRAGWRATEIENFPLPARSQEKKRLDLSRFRHRLKRERFTARYCTVLRKVVVFALPGTGRLKSTVVKSANARQPIRSRTLFIEPPVL